MSTPASTCFVTTSATADATRRSSACASTGTPSSRAYIARTRSSGRGRLPVWVVRKRCVLLCIVVEPSRCRKPYYKPMAAPANVIAHLDMDAFYASVELLRYPELRGKAVVIGGGQRHQPVEYVDPVTQEAVRTFSTLRGYTGRGVITTATYEARALGLHSAMGMMKAAALAPDTVLLPVDFDAYRHYSRLFKVAVAAIAPRIEDRGIDEIYIDLTDVVRAAEGAGAGVGAAASRAAAASVASPDCVRALAQAIKDAVRAATGLSCSIGVAPNKLLAKIASDLDKPGGLTIIGDGDLERRIWPLPARRINGIGPKSAARLETYGIHTIRDLARADPTFLVATFGRAHGEWMHEAAHGRDER